MKIPQSIKSLMTSFHRATEGTDPDDILELSQEQSEERLSNQVRNDKKRAIKKILSEVAIVEARIKNGSTPELEQHLTHLQVQRNELLRDEILNERKRKGNL